MESEMGIYLGYNLRCIAAQGADVEALIRVQLNLYRRPSVGTWKQVTFKTITQS